MTAEALPLHRIAPVSRSYQPCPSWCSHHSDSSGSRSHAGDPAVVIGAAARGGHAVQVGVRVERRDDGAGEVRDVFVLDVAGAGDVDLSVGAVHRLMGHLERLFWSTADGKPSLTRIEADGPVRPDPVPLSVVPPLRGGSGRA